MSRGLSFTIIMLVILFISGSILTFIIENKVSDFLSTPKKVIGELLKILDLKKNETFVELGFGDGDVLLAALEHSKAKVEGYELSPIFAFKVRLKIIFSSLIHFKFYNVTINADNFLNYDFKGKDKLYLNVPEKVTNLFENKAEKLIEDGTQIFVYANKFKNLKPLKEYTLSNGVKLYEY